MTSLPDISRPSDASDFLRPILTGAVRRRYLGMVAVWVLASVYFWQWWLQPSHIGEPVRFVLLTVLIGWVYLLQVYFIFFFLRAVRSVAPDAVPGQYRVAMIVTKTPSEPFSVVEQTLRAMLAQDYPHDTWLADEDPSPETVAWCAAQGVRLSSRKGRADYHRATWPRRTRCKEGNLAFFYDHWGYADYDIVSQLDTDHVPQPGYLREMLRPFADPAVGYVSAPSICAANATQNWAARTRLDTEAAFHGIVQAGYSNGFAPMCIGSHYAVRTAALKQIGGLGPELAEDHSTSLMMNAGGWRGVHAIDAIAVGDGPATVADMVIQEFQWSRSLATLLLQFTSGHLRKLPPRLRVQFLFCQMFYPLLAISLAATYLLPIIAVVFDMRYAEVTYPAYIGHAAPTVIVLLSVAAMIRADDLFRPTNARLLSWEKMLFVLLQWPWVAWGCLMAARDRLTGRFVDFRITPKGVAQGKLPLKVLGVYTALALGSILPVLLVGSVQNAQGFYLLTLLNGLLYSATVAVIVVRHIRENGGRFVGHLGDATLQFGLLAGLLVMVSTALYARSGPSLYALTVGLEPLQIVRPTYAVAGAGSGPVGRIVYEFRVTWK